METEASKTMADEPERKRITCPLCGYSGHGFSYREAVPNYSPIQPFGDGFRVRLDLGDLRYDEADGAELECPDCGGTFQMPTDINISIVHREV